VCVCVCERECVCVRECVLIRCAAVLTFVVFRMQAPIGPPETRCHQSQRYNVYENDHLVLETSQVRRPHPILPFHAASAWAVSAELTLARAVSVVDRS
jgi:hypothetical protein